MFELKVMSKIQGTRTFVKKHAVTITRLKSSWKARIYMYMKEPKDNNLPSCTKPHYIRTALNQLCRAPQSSSPIQSIGDKLNIHVDSITGLFRSYETKTK